LQQDQPKDYVIATGKQHSVRQFVQIAAQAADIKLSWEGVGLDEKAFDQLGVCRVAVDPRYFRAAEVETLLGDSSLAKQDLGWTPQISFKQLVEDMMLSDLKKAQA
jgi:GDPmannose 4,6-dehydratase